MDRISQWKQDAEERQRRVEAERAKLKEEEREETERREQVALREYMTNEIRAATMDIIQAAAVRFTERDNALAKSLAERDEQIRSLQVSVAKADAEIAKLTTRVIESEVRESRERERNSRDRERGDFVPPPRRSELN